MKEYTAQHPQRGATCNRRRAAQGTGGDAHPARQPSQHRGVRMMEWTKEGIMRWMHMHDVYGTKTPSEQRTFESAFIAEANKHQDTAMDRKLYRKGLKIVEARLKNKEQKIQAFLQIESE